MTDNYEITQHGFSSSGGKEPSKPLSSEEGETNETRERSLMQMCGQLGDVIYLASVYYRKREPGPRNEAALWPIDVTGNDDKLERKFIDVIEQDGEKLFSKKGTRKEIVGAALRFVRRLDVIAERDRLSGVHKEVKAQFSESGIQMVAVTQWPNLTVYLEILRTRLNRLSLNHFSSQRVIRLLNSIPTAGLTNVLVGMYDEPLGVTDLSIRRDKPNQTYKRFIEDQIAYRNEEPRYQYAVAEALEPEVERIQSY